MFIVPSKFEIGNLVLVAVMGQKNETFDNAVISPHIIFRKVHYDKIITLADKFLPPNYGARI